MALYYPELQVFQKSNSFHRVVLKFSIYPLKNYKVKKYLDLIIKTYFFNVPNSYNHKRILIALSFLRKVVSVFEI